MGYRRFGRFSAGILVVALTAAACSGTSRHATPTITTVRVPTISSPLVLSDVSGHLSLVVKKTGDYSLESPTTEFFGLLSPQLLVSGDACRYLTGRVVALAKKPVTLAGGGKRAVLTAEFRVTSLTQPLVMAYEVAYTRAGPDVASIDGGPPPACIAG